MRTLIDRLYRPRNRVVAALCVALVVAGVTVAVISLFTSSPARHATALPPTPPSPVSTTADAPSAPSASAHPTSKSPTARKPTHCSSPAPPFGSGSAPFRICIPEIGVDASVMQLGLNSDRTVQVPPLSEVRDAGWYKYSAEPGAVGPTVILGHVDSAQYGEGVFFRLGTLHAGDRVVVDRGDGMVATFRVNSVSQVPKTNFPTQSVYGATSGPALRLVTCGGQFDSATGNYLSNIIAYGSLLSLRHR